MRGESECSTKNKFITRGREIRRVMNEESARTGRVLNAITVIPLTYTRNTTVEDKQDCGRTRRVRKSE